MKPVFGWIMPDVWTQVGSVLLGVVLMACASVIKFYLGTTAARREQATIKMPTKPGGAEPPKPVTSADNERLQAS